MRYFTEHVEDTTEVLWMYVETYGMKKATLDSDQMNTAWNAVSPNNTMNYIRVYHEDEKQKIIESR